MRAYRVLSLCALTALVVSAGVAVAVPLVDNAALTTRSAAAGLAPVFQEVLRETDGTAWVGYAVPMRAGHRICCGSCRSGCRCALEHERGFSHESDTDCPSASREMLVLFRVRNGAVGRMRAFSADCELDAGNLPFIWLTDINARESIELLASIVDSGVDKGRWDDEVHDRALSAIGLHDDPSALATLSQFVKPDRPEELRKQAVFWIAAAGEAAGTEILNRVLRDDPSREVRKQAVFALTLIDETAAVESLIRVARTDDDPEIRGDALFWLGTKAGQQAAAAIADVAIDDPDTEVKKQAVFALSQLPPEEGVPRMIHVALNNSNPEVREQAIFWLSQSDDPRVLDFFEEVLTR